ncbi:MAG: carbonic anhydrase [Planctomycetota bacterium]|nr:carbonic anhydrase [Planctomycetota bacterium]
MSFCTAINCMDGRVQLPVIHFLKERFDAEYVDAVTEPGPNFILSEQTDPQAVESILHRVGISVNKHGSKGIAVVGHYDCARNPAGKDEQFSHTRTAVAFLKEHCPDTKIIALWVDENWQVSEMP